MTANQIFLSALFITSVYLYCFVTGTGVLRLLRLPHSGALAVMTGLMALFAGFELLALPFMLTAGSFRTLTIISLVFGAACFFTALYTCFIRGRTPLPTAPQTGWLGWVIFCIIAVQVAVPVCFARFDGDDAFYIAITTSIQATGKVFANNPSIGLDAFAYPPNYRFTAYEVLITLLGECFHIEPVVMDHTLLPALFIPMYYLANLCLARALYPENRKKQQWFVLLIALFTLFDAYSNYLSSSFLLIKAWMGKGATINHCFIVFLAAFIRMYRAQRADKDTTGWFMLITLCLIAGVGTSSVGLYLIPVAYFCLAGAALFTLNGENKTQTRALRADFVKKAVLSALPSALFLLCYWLMLKQSGGLSQLNAFNSKRSWLDDAALMFKYGLLSLAFYLLGAFYFGLKGNALQRTLFFLGPLVLFLTFLNPLLQPYVGRYLTSQPLYWRFFWLLPLFPTMAAFVIAIWSRYRQRWAHLLLAAALLVIFSPPNFALTQDKYFAPENAGKIPNEIPQTAAAILSHVTTEDPNDLYLLALPKYNIYMRQYTGHIALVMPRLNYVKEAYAYAGRQAALKKLLALFTYDKDGNVDQIVQKLNPAVLRELGITLVITPDSRPELEKAYRKIPLENGDTLYIQNEIFKAKK